MIGLSLVTLGLAGILAAQGQWFIAVPDAVFGIGVGYFAWVSLQEERHPRLPGPAPEASPPPPSPVMPPEKLPPRAPITPPAPLVSPPSRPSRPARPRRRR